MADSTGKEIRNQMTNVTRGKSRMGDTLIPLGGEVSFSRRCMAAKP
jgi:hypothetical protein